MAWHPAMTALVFLIAIAASYGMAMIGEPQSVWLWRDIFGLVHWGR